jgi:uncharacterized small protein (DUF1192 family)
MTTKEIIEGLTLHGRQFPLSATFYKTAADRLEELQRANQNTLADLAVAIEQRDEARAEVERLKAELAAKSTVKESLSVRPDPSRLDIAAMAMQGFITSSGFIIDLPKNSLEYADALIAAASRGAK